MINFDFKEDEYLFWKNKAILVDCFSEIEMNNVEKYINENTFVKYLNILTKYAKIFNKEHIIELLSFYGLNN